MRYFLLNARNCDIDQAIDGWVPGIRSEYPCADLAGFVEAFNGYESSASVRKPAEPFISSSQDVDSSVGTNSSGQTWPYSSQSPPPQRSQPQPQPQPAQTRPRFPPPSPRPSPSPSPSPQSDSDWGMSDPYASSGGTGDTADWGMHDPWASEGGGNSGSGVSGSSNRRW